MMLLFFEAPYRAPLLSQMATMLTRKKDELSTKLERLQEKKTSLQAQMEKLNSDGSGGMAIVSDEEWRLKYESMKAALPQYKKMKKELGDVEVWRGARATFGGKF